jgi:hypothetical protein
MPLLALEKRKFPRVSLPVSGILTYRDGMYPALLENISLAGALVSLQQCDCPPMSRGERCSLALYRGGIGGALQFTTRVVHFGFDMASVRFVNLDQNTRLMLRSVIAHQMPEKSVVTPQMSSCRG